MGCPYESTQPIDEGSYVVPDWMNGKWQEVKEHGGGDIFLLGLAGKKEVLNYIKIDSSGKKDAPVKIILSKVGANVFLNVYEKDDESSSEGYYIFLLKKINDSEFEIWPLKEDLGVNTPQELKEYLQKNEHNNDIYDTTGIGRYKKI
jgi:hypothetical protein